MTIREIVREYLKVHGFDGLCGDECGCGGKDLFICDGAENILECQPGYRVPCMGDDCPNICDAYSEEGKAECYRLTKPVRAKPPKPAGPPNIDYALGEVPKPIGGSGKTEPKA